ncbi:hypothetical protein NP493_1138g00001 [Ridgeia piscesae]|uniref:AMOP domain-containing protein n=1 Tax=Ridgeia piscesae TaxID=27915 RepID=A0AAD9KGJ6_RIDPI|nr:hypothetical protein NP493_1138g00001 [Ridgeia piscesae]
MFIYMDMGWDTRFSTRRSMLGYFSYKHEQEEALQLAPSMKSTSFRMQNRIGNKGEQGSYMFRVASGSGGINFDQKCFNWFANEMRRLSIVRYSLSWTLACPCDLRLADMDGRWRFDWPQYFNTNLERMCFYEKIPWFISTQECCYSQSGFLINTEDGRGGQSFLYHPYYYRQHQKFDVDPKKWCCEYSDNCNFFYFVRPLDRCWNYMPLDIGQ